jgi:hypothetical protein
MKEIRARALHDKWMKTDPAYRREYQALEPERFAKATGMRLRISFEPIAAA